MSEGELMEKWKGENGLKWNVERMRFVSSDLEIE